MFGRGRKYLIITGNHDDGYRRDEMRERMRNESGHRGGSYDEGYRRGYEHAWKDHEREMMEDDENFRRNTRY